MNHFSILMMLNCQGIWIKKAKYIIEYEYDRINRLSNRACKSRPKSQTCGIVNNFEITAEDEFIAGSSIIAQGTADSSALEKITKLKQQWLSLLP